MRLRHRLRLWRLAAEVPPQAPAPVAAEHVQVEALAAADRLDEAIQW